MKFLVVFAALVSVVFGSPSSWTLSELSQAIDNPSTSPALLPYLKQALDEMMASLIAGEQINTITVTIPALDLSSWSLSQLSDALDNPNTDPALLPYLEHALDQLMDALIAGQPVSAVAAVVVPSMDVSLWTLNELSDALENPTTNPALVPYLEQALNEMMNSLFAGQQVDSIIVVAPVGLLPVENPISPMPVVPSPVEVPVESPAVPSSPLVQIIVNVNKGAGVAPAPVIKPEPVIIPDPVIVVEQPEIAPEPVIVVDSPTIVPEPVVIGTPVLPNPVDLMHPIGVVTPIGAGAEVVGPIV